MKHSKSSADLFAANKDGGDWRRKTVNDLCQHTWTEPHHRPTSIILSTYLNGTSPPPYKYHIVNVLERNRGGNRTAPPPYKYHIVNILEQNPTTALQVSYSIAGLTATVCQA